MLTITKTTRLPDSWDKLVAACPWGTFYQSQANIHLIRNMTGAHVNVLLAEANGRLVGGLPFAVHDGPWGPVVNCLAYFGSYGEAVTADAPAQTLEKLYAAMLAECRKQRALALTVITSPLNSGARHDRIGGWLQPTYVDRRNCQITPLPAYNGNPAEYGEQILALLKPRVRSRARKAAREQFQLKTADTWAELQTLHHFHEAAIGAKGGSVKTAAFFRACLPGEENHLRGSRIDVLLKDGRIVAGLISFRFADQVEYYTPVMHPDWPTPDPLIFLVSQRMAKAGRTGARWFNFGGTWPSQTGLHQFKRGFGALDHPYRYLTVLFRDADALRQRQPADIRQAYPHFFVLPFNELS